ncbi:MAG: hypothetical protein QXD94_06485 [Sulfolobales archaeon]
MSDLLSHYVLSLLISSRFTKLKYALLLAILGLSPDIDICLYCFSHHYQQFLNSSTVS